MSTNQPSVVYLVEDHTPPKPETHTKYWAHVHLSRDNAMADVETQAHRGGHGTVRWADHSPVLYAYAGQGTQAEELYRVVPLSVH